MHNYGALSWYTLEGVQKDIFLNLGEPINWQRMTEDGVEFPMLYLVVSGVVLFQEGEYGITGNLGEGHTFNAIFVPTGLGYRIIPARKDVTVLYLFEQDKISVVIAEPEPIHKAVTPLPSTKQKKKKARTKRVKLKKSVARKKRV